MVVKYTRVEVGKSVYLLRLGCASKTLFTKSETSNVRQVAPRRASKRYMAGSVAAVGEKLMPFGISKANGGAPQIYALTRKPMSTRDAASRG